MYGTVYFVPDDSCVSFAEYHNPETQALFFEINMKMYLHFDPDGDDCLDVDEMNEEFHKIDQNCKKFMLIITHR